MIISINYVFMIHLIPMNVADLFEDIINENKVDKKELFIIIMKFVVILLYFILNSFYLKYYNLFAMMINIQTLLISSA
jgi:hypothetical protein